MRVLEKGLARCPSLVSLDLSLNEIGDLGAKYIGRAVNTARNVEHLYLHVNRIGPRGAIDLTSFLVHAGALRSLDLSSNPIGDDGFHAIAKMIVDRPLIARHPDDRTVTDDHSTQMENGVPPVWDESEDLVRSLLKERPSDDPATTTSTMMTREGGEGGGRDDTNNNHHHNDHDHDHDHDNNTKKNFSATTTIPLIKLPTGHLRPRTFRAVAQAVLATSRLQHPSLVSLPLRHLYLNACQATSTGLQALLDTISAHRRTMTHLRALHVSGNDVSDRVALAAQELGQQRNFSVLVVADLAEITGLRWWTEGQEVAELTDMERMRLTGRVRKEMEEGEVPRGPMHPLATPDVFHQSRVPGYVPPLNRRTVVGVLSEKGGP